MLNPIIKRLIYGTLVLMAGAFLLLQFKASIKPGISIEGPHLLIGRNAIKVEIADDFMEQIRGLSYRPSLAPDAGMLFIFKDKQIRRFWMKDMNFPLDIIWINDNKIVKIDENLPPEGSEPQNKYSSEVPVNYVLEVNGGYCAEHKVKPGQEIIFKIN